MGKKIRRELVIIPAVMGIPLYRQEREWERQSLLSQQTMSNWLIKAAEDWLEPIYDALFEHKRQFADLTSEKWREARVKTAKPETEAFFA